MFPRPNHGPKPNKYLRKNFILEVSPRPYDEAKIILSAVWLRPTMHAQAHRAKAKDGQTPTDGSR